MRKGVNEASESRWREEEEENKDKDFDKGLLPCRPLRSGFHHSSSGDKNQNELAFSRRQRKVPLP